MPSDLAGVLNRGQGSAQNLIWHFPSVELPFYSPLFSGETLARDQLHPLFLNLYIKAVQKNGWTVRRLDAAPPRLPRSQAVCSFRISPGVQVSWL